VLDVDQRRDAICSQRRGTREEKVIRYAGSMREEVEEVEDRSGGKSRTARMASLEKRRFEKRSDVVRCLGVAAEGTSECDISVLRRV